MGAKKVPTLVDIINDFTGNQLGIKTTEELHWRVEGDDKITSVIGRWDLASPVPVWVRIKLREKPLSPATYRSARVEITCDDANRMSEYECRLICKITGQSTELGKKRIFHFVMEPTTSKTGILLSDDPHAMLVIGNALLHFHQTWVNFDLSSYPRY